MTALVVNKGNVSKRLFECDADDVWATADPPLPLQSADRLTNHHHHRDPAADKIQALAMQKQAKSSFIVSPPQQPQPLTPHRTPPAGKPPLADTTPRRAGSIYSDFGSPSSPGDGCKENVQVAAGTTPPALPIAGVDYAKQNALFATTSPRSGGRKHHHHHQQQQTPPHSSLKRTHSRGRNSTPRTGMGVSPPCSDGGVGVEEQERRDKERQLLEAQYVEQEVQRMLDNLAFANAPMMGCEGGSQFQLHPVLEHPKKKDVQLAIAEGSDLDEAAVAVPMGRLEEAEEGQQRNRKGSSAVTKRRAAAAVLALLIVAAGVLIVMLFL